MILRQKCSEEHHVDSFINYPIVELLSQNVMK